VSTEKQRENARINGRLGGRSDHLLDLTGKRIGDWTVLHRKGNAKDRRATWWCRCVCGVEREVHGGNLAHGGSLGCGCTKKGLRLRPYEALYNTISRMNTDKEVDMTYDEFTEFTKNYQCHYCGVGVHWAEFDIIRNGSNYNLDRKDNSLGYCVVCCARCNRSKSNHFTYAEWVQIGALIRTWPT